MRVNTTTYPFITAGVAMTIQDKITRIFFLVLITAVPCTVYAQADTPRDASTFTFYQENDLYTGTDRDYTNGIKLTWISADLTDYRNNPNIPQWSYPLVESLPFVNEPGYVRTLSFSIGQNIYTPENIKESGLQEGDHPYAGISYCAIGFHSRNNQRMHTLELDMGIVGPHSYAEKIQKAVHRWTDSKYPSGWDNQIKDEPFLNVYYERKVKFLGTVRPAGIGYDIIPHLGCSVGNAYTAASAGAQVRWGWNLPNDFGTSFIRPGSDTNAPYDEDDPRFFPESGQFGVHVFAALHGSAVLRNVVLDGNLYRTSYHVDKEPFVAHVLLGFGMIVHRFKITYAYVHATRQFKTQDDSQAYGTISVSYTF